MKNQLKCACSHTKGVYSFLASSNICRLLITFANNLDQDQDLHNVGHFDCVLKDIFEKVNFEKS